MRFCLFEYIKDEIFMRFCLLSTFKFDFFHEILLFFLIMAKSFLAVVSLKRNVFPSRC